MLKAKTIAIFSFVIFNLAACKKDKQNNTACVLNETNLMGTYKYGAVTYKASPSAVAVDATSMVDACSLDDLITIGANHLFSYTDAGVKCNPPGDGTASWSLQGNIFTAAAQSGPVEKFSCSSFTVAHANFFTASDTLLITFVKQ